MSEQQIVTVTLSIKIPDLLVRFNHVGFFLDFLSVLATKPNLNLNS